MMIVVVLNRSDHSMSTDVAILDTNTTVPSMIDVVMCGTNTMNDIKHMKVIVVTTWTVLAHRYIPIDAVNMRTSRVTTVVVMLLRFRGRMKEMVSDAMTW
jgi:hypothetical protein